jgi:hypothetical protein
MIQVMMDLETMGNQSKAAIISIGAVKFDPEGPELLENSFYTRIDLESSVQCGLEMDTSTILWWMGQSQAARASILSEDPATVHLRQAMRDFADWYGMTRLPIWGNGAASDNVWMKSAFRASGVECPWTHKEDRCYRTVREMFPKVETEFKGIKHHALHDAIYQARHLLNMMEEMPEGHGLL